jgi:hypothetical protein
VPPEALENRIARENTSKDAVRFAHLILQDLVAKSGYVRYAAPQAQAGGWPGIAAENVSKRAR